jgi:hypothetical protein
MTVCSRDIAHASYLSLGQLFKGCGTRWDTNAVWYGYGYGVDTDGLNISRPIRPRAGIGLFRGELWDDLIVLPLSACERFNSSSAVVDWST